MKKKIVLMLIIIIVSLFFVNVSYAEDSRRSTINETIDSAKNFITSANTTNTFNQDAMKKNVSFIYNTFFACGMVIAVVVGAILGIQFMFESTEGKAKIKEKLLPYFLGCFILFGAFGIWKIVILIMGKF